jgi:L-rhamnose-H+ transport protein
VGLILQRPGSSWVVAGLAAGTLGIAICGLAGRLKERDLDRSAGRRGEFSLSKGLLLSLVAGILSAVYGLALEVAAPVANLAEQYGAGIWTGAFVTSLLYCLYLGRRHHSIGELVRLPASSAPRTLAWNYLFALLTGTLWYGQFFFYNLGHVRLGAHYAFSSWAIHMIMLVLFSNLLAVWLKEWRGSSAGTRLIICAGIAVLCGAVLMLTWGNRLGELS